MPRKATTSRPPVHRQDDDLPADSLLASNPAAFRCATLIQTSDGPKLLGECLADFQVERFNALDPALIAVARGTKPPVSQFWIETVKSSSKTSDIALSVIWMLLASKRALQVQVAAADADQAGLILRASRELLRLNPAFGASIEIQAKAIINRKTEARADILASDSASAHGALPDLLIIDELTHIANEEFVSTLLFNAGKSERSAVIILTNAGVLDSYQWRMREVARQSAGWTFLRHDKLPAWTNRESLRELELLFPRLYDRLYRCRWVEKGGSEALKRVVILAAVNQPGPMTGAEPGWAFVGGIDVGIKHDHTGFVVLAVHVGETKRVPREVKRIARPAVWDVMADLGMLDSEGEAFATPPADDEWDWVTEPGTDKIRLAYCESWKPKPGQQVDLEVVEAAVLQAHRKFNFAIMAYDPHEMGSTQQRLSKLGLPMLEVPFRTAQLEAMAAEVVQRFNAREVELYNHPDLIQDLIELQISEGTGRVRLIAPKSSERGHGDRGTAFSIAAFAARRVVAFGGSTQINGPLICSPS